LAFSGTLPRLFSLLLVAALVALVAAAAIVVFEFVAIPISRAPGEIQITKVLLDRVDAPTGSTLYLLELNASNPGPTTWRFDPAFLEVSSNASHVYKPESNYNATSVLGVIDLPRRSSKVGLVAFGLPKDEVPSHLRYLDPSTGLRFDVGAVPRQSSVASRFNFEVHLTVNGLPVDSDGWTVNGCPQTSSNGTGPWVCSIIANGLIRNDSLIFFTGQKIQVDLWFEYLKLPRDPMAIILESFAGDGVFPIVRSQPSLPVVMTGWGSQAGLVVWLEVPAGQHSGTLNLSVRFSA
jgi:hypothetical protein